MTEPLVSIITPSLNQGAFIEQAIASVREQSYTRVQHVVVDGGSTDGTLTILSGQPGLRWVSEPDRGMYDALNKGIRLSEGEILGYLNCDDAYTPWAIEMAVRAFEADPSATVVFGDGLTVDVARGRQRLSLIPPFDARWLAFAGSLVQPAVFWRRRAYEAVGEFDAGLRFVGDIDLWLRMGAAGSIVRLDEVLAIERLHDAALSQASSDRMGVEDAATRRRHHGATGRRAAVGLTVARARAAWHRRRLLLLFLREARRRDSARRWSRFLREGDVQVSPARVVLSFLPRLGASFAWGAVTSRRRWLERPGAGGDEGS